LFAIRRGKRVVVDKPEKPADLQAGRRQVFDPYGGEWVVCRVAANRFLAVLGGLSHERPA
jgi:hypothetical protein